MLGPLEVRNGAGSPREVSGTRLRALLVLLALRGGHLAARAAEAFGGGPGQIAAVSYTACGYLAAEEGDLAAARAWQERALATALPTGDAPVIAEVLTGLADLALRGADGGRAATLLGAAGGVRGTRNRSDEDSARVTSAARALLAPADYDAAFARGQRVTADTLEEALGSLLHGNEVTG
jgi:hypothetical protein